MFLFYHDHTLPDMKQLTVLQQRIMAAGGILMVLGAMLFLLNGVCATVLFAVGSVLYSAMQLNQTYEGRNFVIQRLRRQQLFGCVCLIGTAVLMSMQSLHWGFACRNEWVVCLAIGAVVQLYTAFRLSSELKKEGEK